VTGASRLMNTRTVRELARRLRHTMLHPQWLLLRHERELGNLMKSRLHGVVLDVGCADMTARQLVIQAGADYIGLDYPRTALNLYDTRPDVFGDAHCLPMRSESVDGVLLLNVLEHVRDADTVMNEAARILRPGGICFIEVPFLYPLHDRPFDFRRWTGNGLAQTAERAGLHVTSLLPVGTAPETMGLLANLSLARALIRLAAARNPLAILGVLAPAAFLATNILARMLAWLADDDWMPTVYRAVLTKPPTPTGAGAA
jgi:SAM-dependent methyltransferase